MTHEIECANAQWPPFGPWIKPSDFFGKWLELPRTLRGYANAWKKQFKHSYRAARSPRNENIIRLLRYVKKQTRRYHYEEVADLLNATDAAYGWETLSGYSRWTATNLSSVIKRKKK
jgi:hypothetical protein